MWMFCLCIMCRPGEDVKLLLELNLWTNIRVQRTKTRPSKRAASTLNCWAISPASILEHCIAFYKELLPSAGPWSFFRALQWLVTWSFFRALHPLGIRKNTFDECPSATSLHSLGYSSGLSSRMEQSTKGDARANADLFSHQYWYFQSFKACQSEGGSVSPLNSASAHS